MNFFPLNTILQKSTWSNSHCGIQDHLSRCMELRINVRHFRWGRDFMEKQTSRLPVRVRCIIKRIHNPISLWKKDIGMKPQFLIEYKKTGFGFMQYDLNERRFFYMLFISTRFIFNDGFCKYDTIDKMIDWSRTTNLFIITCFSGINNWMDLIS